MRDCVGVAGERSYCADHRRATPLSHEHAQCPLAAPLATRHSPVGSAASARPGSKHAAAWIARCQCMITPDTALCMQHTITHLCRPCGGPKACTPIEQGVRGQYWRLRGADGRVRTSLSSGSEAVTPSNQRRRFCTSVTGEVRNLTQRPTPWLRTQSASDRSPGANSLLTGKLTGNFLIFGPFRFFWIANACVDSMTSGSNSLRSGTGNFFGITGNLRARTGIPARGTGKFRQNPSFGVSSAEAD